MGGAIAAALDASDVTSRLGGESAPWLLWLLVVIGGVVLTGGVMDRYARQRPLDARTFWGVSGELAFRLIRLSAIGGALFTVLTGALVLVLDAIATAVLAAAGPERGEAMLWALELGLARSLPRGGARAVRRDRRRPGADGRRAPAQRAVRVHGRRPLRLAAPRRRSSSSTRRCSPPPGSPGRCVSAAELWLEPGVGLARLLDAVQVGAAITAALVSAAAATAAVPGRAGARVLRRAAAPGLAGLPRHRDARGAPEAAPT